MHATTTTTHPRPQDLRRSSAWLVDRIGWVVIAAGRARAAASRIVVTSQLGPLPEREIGRHTGAMI